MLGTGAANLRASNGFDEGLNLHQDVKLDSDLVTKLALNQFTPPSKLIQKLEIQASDKADKLTKAQPRNTPIPVDDEPEPAAAAAAAAAQGQPAAAAAANYQKDNNFKQVAASIKPMSMLSESLIGDKKEAPVERLLRLKVHLLCLPPIQGGDFAFMEIAVPVSITVEDVIKYCLKTYNEEKRKPALVESAALYELRTYSESSFDNDDDDDDFPLDKKSEIAKCGVRVAALARAPGVESAQIVVAGGAAESRASIFPDLPPAGGAPSGDTAYIRVLMDSHSITVPVPKDSTMEKLLTAVAKKQKQNMSWEQYEFMSEEKSVDRDTIVSDLTSTTLVLRRKGRQPIKYIPPSGSEPGLVIFPDRVHYPFFFCFCL
jgi:hypothetical protein